MDATIYMPLRRQQVFKPAAIETILKDNEEMENFKPGYIHLHNRQVSRVPSGPVTVQEKRLSILHPNSDINKAKFY